MLALLVLLVGQTERWIRVGELIRENSSKARCVIITMPFPRDADDPFDFMSQLETVSADLPPTILMRGAGNVVLSFYLE